MSGPLTCFFVLSPRGDTIIKKEYRFDPASSTDLKSSIESFFRKIKFWDAENAEAGAGVDNVRLDNVRLDAPPMFLMGGESFLHIKRSGLIFACSTRYNTSPSSVVELLAKIARVFKDYCGTLSEEAIRKNFVLLYELLDEMIDYGYPQVTTTENLKMFVYNEPIPTAPAAQTSDSKLKSGGSKTASATSVHKPISTAHGNGSGGKGAGAKNEIFVDILERLNVLFSPNGYILNSSIDGCIQMKSYLTGNPELRLALNEDLIVGKDRGKGAGYGTVVLDDLNFNDVANLAEFDSEKTLSFYPPDGEFVLLNYRIAGEFPCPFKIRPSIDQVSPTRLEITITVKNDIPPDNYGANVSIKIPLPRSTATVSCDMLTPAAPGDGAEYVSNLKHVTWNIKKFNGNSEASIKIKISTDTPTTSQTNKEIGPISMNFEIPMFNVSNLQVRYLRIQDTGGKTAPFRWVRYVTQSSSYVCRL
jgi:AP-4 complex subunit mu-1